MNTLTKILFIIALILSSNVYSFGQFGTGSGNSMKPRKTFEHTGCGFRIRFPFPRRYTKSTSVGFSPYRNLGQGIINRFESGAVTYDTGCIDLDDPPRKLKKDKLISVLNSNTKVYLMDSSEYTSLPKTTVKDKEIYEFKTKTNSLRHIRYVLEGNRVSIFLATAADLKGIMEALKLFSSVQHFSVREYAEKRMEAATQKALPQSPTLKRAQTDAAHKNLTGPVKSVRIEAEDVPILAGITERRIRSNEIYDKAGNLLKDFWFQDAGYPTSVSIYGFVDKMRVSVSERIGNSTVIISRVSRKGTVELPPPDPRYEYRYAYRYDISKRIIERKRYDNRGNLRSIYTLAYKDDRMEEKWFGADRKLNSTIRWQLDKNRNELNYEFWWGEQTDKEVETYSYKRFDRFGNWTERRVVKKIIDRGLKRTRTYDEFRTITYHGK